LVSRDTGPRVGVSPRGGKKTAGGLLGLVLLLIYWFVQPVLNERLGLNLPKIGGKSEATRTADADVSPGMPDSMADAKPEVRPDSKPENSTPAVSNPDSSSATKPDSKPENTRDSSATDSSATDSPASDSGLRYGILREIQTDRFMSPAGLLYTPGSQEGHRLKHVEKHTRDEPSRPGSHGVFDGGMEAAVRFIDQAYERAKSGKSGVTTEEEDGRTVYTVSMGTRVGYVGGRDGNRKNKPMARRIRLVLDGNRVITAFPL
jgi:hypothetical protein